MSGEQISLADVLADLNRAKCIFQLRTLAAVIGQGIETGTDETARLGAKHESPVATPCPGTTAFNMGGK